MSTSIILSKFNDDTICAYRHLKEYLRLRPKIEGQLYCHLNNKNVTRFQFLSVLRSALKFLSFNPNEYNTHSFRIGAATSAYLEGKHEEDIKFMGRWSSNSFKSYIRIGRLVN